MKKLIQLTALFVFAAALASGVRAQTQTAVTGTIQDTNGIPYANGTFSVQLIPTGTNPSVNGASIGGSFVGATDVNGKFNLSLWPNASITPGGTQWQFTVCSNPGGIQPPLGTGGQCTPPTAITISGASQNVSSTLNAVAPALTHFLGGGTGTIAGTVTTFHIPFATALNTIGDIPGSAVTAATGAISLTAGADTTVPLTVAAHSSTQSADLLDVSSQFAFATGTGHFNILSSGYADADTGIQLHASGSPAAAGVSHPFLFYSPGENGGAPATVTSNGNGGSTHWEILGDGSVGGATSGNGGPGGDWILGGASGGNATAGNGNGGAGGQMHWGGGNGGNGVGTGSGGDAMAFQIPIAGTGFGGNAGASGGNGGKGSDFIIAPGAGGNAPAGTGGRSGDFLYISIPGGTGGTAAGRSGEFILNRGNAGAIGDAFLNIEDVWTTTGKMDADIFLDVQGDSGPATADSLLMDLQYGNTTVFDLVKNGATTQNCTLNATINNCVTIQEAAATPSSVTNPHMILVKQLTGSSASPFAVDSAALNAATGQNAAAALYVGGIKGGLVSSTASNGFVGAPISLLAGAGSPGGSVSGTGGTGGQTSIASGGGGNATATAATGGTGGNFLLSAASGGNGGATGNGGNAGGVQINFTGQTGGNGGATSGNGGSGPFVTIDSGPGGTAASGTTGAGGDIVIGMGAAGLGAGTPGRPGELLITQGAVTGSNATPTIVITPTWNTSGVIDAALKIAVTDTASGAGSLIMDLFDGLTSEFKVDKSGATTAAGTITGPSYATTTNCASAASPAVCGSAAAGRVVIAAGGATTVVVDTTAVTANSEIIPAEDQSLGTALSVTCNTQALTTLGNPRITARSPGTSFTIGIDVSPTTNPMCISYDIRN